MDPAPRHHPTAGEASAYRRGLLRSIPLVLAVPVVLGFAIVLAGSELRLVPLLLGAVGWVVALALRAPVAIVAMRGTRDRASAQTLITGSSGPLEEVVRLGVLLLLGRDLATALSVGLGWAAIEVAYSIVNGFAIVALAGRTDPEAEQARALLPPATLEPSAPAWGVVERIWASVLHIGFTLIVAAQPVLVVVTALVHSAVNLGLVRALRVGWSLARIAVAGSLIAAGVLLAGIALWRPS